MLEHTFLPSAGPGRPDVLPEARSLSQALLNQGYYFQYSNIYDL
jgi:hypothetical protein